jgi:hypothetical protein
MNAPACSPAGARRLSTSGRWNCWTGCCPACRPGSWSPPNRSTRPPPTKPPRQRSAPHAPAHSEPAHQPGDRARPCPRQVRAVTPAEALSDRREGLQLAGGAVPGPLRFACEPGQPPRPGAGPDPQAAALRRGRRPGLRGGVPARGCRPGRVPAAAPRTGIAHNLAAVPVFVGLPAAALASGWRSWRAGRRRFGLYSAGTAVTMLTTMARAGAGFGQSPRLVNLGGLFQRAAIITGFAWLTALSAQALRRTPTAAAPRHQAG